MKNKQTDRQKFEKYKHFKHFQKLSLKKQNKKKKMNSSEKDVSDMLKKTFTPILLAIGIVGNLISMLIFSNESLKKYTTFRLLFLLSLIDICVLLTGCGDILLQVPITVNLLQIRIESSLESKKKRIDY